jgi:carbamoyltransferase
LNEISSIKSKIPGVTHLDGSARVQTINSADTSFSRTLLEEFYEVSQMPVLINTSFNVRGEPMVSSPEDALNCFMTTGIDFLYLEGLVVDKNQVSNAQKEKFVSKVEED